MSFKNLSNTQRNSVKTVVFYAVYILLTVIGMKTLPGGYCGPGPNAILILLAPFVVGLSTIINGIRTYLNREHLGSLLIHSFVLVVLGVVMCWIM